MSDLTGFFTTATNMSGPWNAAFVGASLYSQTYTADPTKSPLPISVSQGVRAIVPGLAPLPGAYGRIYPSDAPNASKGYRGPGLRIDDAI